MLQDIVASVEDTEFEIEDALDKQLGSRPMPFVGMDSECINIVTIIPDRNKNHPDSAYKNTHRKQSCLV